MRGSLVVATYEMPRHLALVCAALLRQTVPGDELEVIFCDDGSGPETRALIDAFRAEAPFSVQHLWQEHQGFRKCRILNEALRKSRGETLIFLDGDCVPHRDFVRDHLEEQESGRFLAGRRVELGPEISEWLTPNHVRAGFFDSPRWPLVRSVWRKDSQHLQRTIRVKNPLLRKVMGLEHVDDLKGCNYSVARSALLQINGFDEAYEGYGREDTDVEIRLQNLGLRIKSLKGLALQFHVWHPRRAFTPSNDQRLEEARTTKRVRCELGVERA